MLIRRLFFLLMMFTFACPIMPSAFARTRAEFKAEFLSELVPSFKQIARSTRFYHYGSRKPVDHVSHRDLNSISPEIIDLRRGTSGSVQDYESPVEVDAPEIRNYFLDMTSHFSDEKPFWNIGQGLYTSIDPVQSEDYAGHPWFLLEITTPIGMRYLDLKSTNGTFLTSEFVKRWTGTAFLAGLQITGTGAGGSGPQYVEIKPILRHPILGMLFKEMLKEQGIDAIAYGWRESGISFCSHLNHQLVVGFDFINPNTLNKGIELKVFVQNMGADADPAKRAEYARVLDLLDASTVHLENFSGTRESIEWRSVMAKARLLTLGWAALLGRISPLATLLPDLNAMQILRDYFLRSDTQVGPLPLLRFNPAYAIFLPNLPASSGRPPISLDFDPLSSLEKDHPAEFQQRLQLIQNTIFGCHPDYPNEWLR